ncbi:hypothetical protein LINGRAHAP2_LOCUS10934 [Linum grandiflorum]
MGSQQCFRVPSLGAPYAAIMVSAPSAVLASSTTLSSYDIGRLVHDTLKDILPSTLTFAFATGHKGGLVDRERERHGRVYSLDSYSRDGVVARQKGMNLKRED